jgi:hypothetical protein
MRRCEGGETEAERREGRVRLLIPALLPFALGCATAIERNAKSFVEATLNWMPKIRR